MTIRQHALAPSLLGPLLLLTSALVACRAPETVTGGASASFAATTDDWHVKRVERLAAPDGWLSLVALAWLQPGANRVGRAPDAQVSYAGLPADHVGTIFVSAEGLRFESAPGVTVEGVPEDGALRSDADGKPTVLALGDIRFHVVIRGGTPAVRMKDAAAPTRANFAGIARFQTQEEWRITAAFEPAFAGSTIGLDTVIGVTAEGAVAGRARFERDGVQVDAVLLKSGEGSLLRFSDTTCGAQTYTIGRYLYVEPSPDGETVTLDFNRAYNPPCAFTAFATCTLAPEENRFAFAVTAGERWDGSEAVGK